MKKFTLRYKLKLIWEILTSKNGENTPVEKQLSTFMNGYNLGLIDGQLESKYNNL